MELWVPDLDRAAASWGWLLTALGYLTESAQRHGWQLMFADRHPHAGGDQHYAAYLENDDGFEVELVASRAEQAG